MGLIDLANRNSFWRGIEYFKNKKVLSSERIDDNTIKGKVSGTEMYEVLINLEHPKKSKCSCPFTKENSKICKHMVALYFYNFPNEAKKIIKEEELIEKREREQYERISKYVNTLSIEQLRTELIGALIQIEDMNDEYYDEEEYYY